MNRVIALLLGLVAVAPLGATDRQGSVPLCSVEEFQAADKPRAVVVGDRTWHTPWGYDKEPNAQRRYPLVVFGPHNKASEFFTTDIRKRYPAFTVSYIERSEAAGAALADLIDVCMKDHHFRIDTRRIYLTGWSAGGSGSFKLVRGFLSKGKFFAAINRVAGQSESILAEEAVTKTAIWLHIGLHDTPRRVQVSRDLYDHLKNHSSNASAVETVIDDTIEHGDADVPRQTKVLTKDGVEIVRYTEYPTEGHAAFASYSDPYLYEWLFTRAICPDPNAPDTEAVIQEEPQPTGDGAWRPYQNRYAIIVMSDGANSDKYFWPVTHSMYGYLREMGFGKENIRFLAPAQYVTAHPDVVFDEACEANIAQAYAWAKSACTSDDLLYVFWISHGHATTFTTAGGPVKHAMLARWMDGIEAKQIIGVYQPCHSGCVVDDISRPGVITTTSTDPDKGNGWPWAENIAFALAGPPHCDQWMNTDHQLEPAKFPADRDGDGQVSVTEAYTWVARHHYTEGSMFDDNGDGRGGQWDQDTFDPNDPDKDGYVGRHYSLRGWKPGQ